MSSVSSPTGSPSTASPVDGLPATWPARAFKLRRLLETLAAARRLATQIHAEAYLAAEGTGPAREETAKLAAADTTELVGQLVAELEAYRLLIDLARDGVL